MGAPDLYVVFMRLCEAIDLHALDGGATTLTQLRLRAERAAERLAAKVERDDHAKEETTDD